MRNDFKSLKKMINNHWKNKSENKYLKLWNHFKSFITSISFEIRHSFNQPNKIIKMMRGRKWGLKKLFKAIKFMIIQSDCEILGKRKYWKEQELIMNHINVMKALFWKKYQRVETKRCKINSEKLKWRIFSDFDLITYFEPCIRINCQNMSRLKLLVFQMERIENALIQKFSLI
jgi:hypothetical protein